MKSYSVTSIGIWAAACLALAGCSRHGAKGWLGAGQDQTGRERELTLGLGHGVSMKLVLIPAGTFMMGSPAGEKGRFDNEGPQHKVTISKPFYMGIYEVTQAQYQAVMGTHRSFFHGPQNPVDSVSWNDAEAFCQKLSQKTGRKVELPTEAQWEYACRAGSTTRFYYGNDPDSRQLGEYAWYLGNSNFQTHPVGQKKPNAWGLYDMYGNVWEWCRDWYGPYAKAKAVDPTGPDCGSYRVLRGGSGGNHPRDCRSAFRLYDVPGDRDSFGAGFRVVVVVGGVD